MKNMTLGYLILSVLILLFLYLISTAHIRHAIIDGQRMTAWYIMLPGWSEVYYPEIIVDLKPWMGSGIKDLTVKEDGENSPELQAAIALKGLGVYGDDYETKKIDGEWVLFRPSRSEKYFTLTAFYRISPYTSVTK